MALMYIFTHNLRLTPLLVRSKLRGIKPEEITLKVDQRLFFGLKSYLDLITYIYYTPSC